MAELSIGDAVGSGFQVIRRRPLAVVSWGLVELAFGVVTLALFGSVFMDTLLSALPNIGAGPGGSGAGRIPIVTLQRMAQLQGASLLLNLGGVFVRSVIACAVLRAVLHPEESRFGYLRLGTAELFLSVLTIAAVIAIVIGVLVPVVVVAAVVGGLVAVHAGAAAAIVSILAAVGFIVGLVYVALRFSLVAPMIVDDGKFHLFDAWALTKRHAGGLFVVALCLFGILIVGETIVGLVMVVTGMSVLGSIAGGLSNLPNFFRQPPSAIVASLTPVFAVAALIAIPLSGCVHAILGAPWARAYRDLSGPDLAATFS